MAGSFVHILTKEHVAFLMGFAGSAGCCSPPYGTDVSEVTGDYRYSTGQTVGSRVALGNSMPQGNQGPAVQVSSDPDFLALQSRFYTVENKVNHPAMNADAAITKSDFEKALDADYERRTSAFLTMLEERDVKIAEALRLVAALSEQIKRLDPEYGEF